MSAEKEKAGERIFEELLGSDASQLTAKNPAVLSCGGIYIPHRGQSQHTLYQVLNTASKEEPVKVFTGFRPRNLLRELLFKESLN